MMLEKKFKKFQEFIQFILNFEIPPKSFYFSSDSLTNELLFQELLEYISIPLNFFGFGVYSDNYEFFNLRFKFWTLFSIITSSIIVKNVVDFYEDTVKFLFSFLILSILPQIAARFYSFIALRKNHLALRNFTEKIIRDCLDEKSRIVIEKWILKATHIIFIYILINFVMVIFFISFPILYLLIEEKRILLIGIELPFMDWKTSWAAYFLHVLFQDAVSLIYMYSTVPVVAVVISFLSISFAQFDILKTYLSDINEIVEDEGKIQELLKKISMYHVTVIKYEISFNIKSH